MLPSRHPATSTLALCLCLAACAKPASQTDAAPAPASSQPPVAAAPTPSASPSAPSPSPSASASASPAAACPACVSGLPALDADARMTKSMEDKVARLDASGLRLHQAGKHAEAAAVFEQAVTLAPGHVLSRYDLGCALARAGQPERALGVLVDLARAGCKQCKTQLAFARQDIDWSSLWSSPVFQALTGDAGALGPRPATRAVSRMLTTGKTDEIEPFLPAEGTVSVVYVDSLSQDSAPAPKKLKATELKAAGRSLGQRGRRGESAPQFNDIESPTCDAACCQSHRSGMLHNNIYLDKVCISNDPAGRAIITSIAMVDGD